jgi:hypothetical protein
MDRCTVILQSATGMLQGILPAKKTSTFVKVDALISELDSGAAMRK